MKGWGKEAVTLLDSLATAVLSREFKPRGINRAEEGLASVGDDGKDEEGDDVDDIDDDVSIVADEDDEGDGSNFKEDQEAALRQSHRKILVSNVDSVEWRLELERVGNRLTAAKRSEGWRGRVQFMVAEGGVAELPEVGRLGTGVGGEGERVREGERRVQGGAEVESIR